MSKTKYAEQAVVNIGMVGHVDHGKTSLTEALTGKWTDTHSEELRKGISIRLGYADATFYKCPKCKGTKAYTNSEICPNCKSKTKKLRKVSFVDAPGHETLMTTMLSGAAIMQGAILVIAANEECPQPRTIEHLMALKLSGIEKIVVAQNKIDLVTEKEATENYKQITKFLKENNINAPIIPTAANFRINIDALIEAIEETIPTPKFNVSGNAKMYVVRSFDINKPGTKPEQLKGGVVGGSIIQGTIKKGEEIVIAPGFGEGPLTTKAVSFAVEDGLLKEARPGGLVAIGTELDPSLTQNDRMRGQIVAKPGTLPKSSKEVKLKIVFLERLLTEQIKKLEINEPLVLTIGTMTNVGIVRSFRDNIAELYLKSEAIIEKGQKIAISKRIEGQWRLIAYGEAL
ncbi:MAG: translation initiation factor IF-2 subunit gamma [Candidatus Diapherotrites archaeon]|nr:translation initiation factor IF-2 subunit gamma [Candidatus Diapherotrites archaeon]